MEVQAANHVKNREWAQALEIYNKLLQKQENGEEQLVSYCLDRSECLYHLGHHERVITDCKHILKSFSGKYNSTNEPRTRIQLIRSLFAINRLAEAEMVIKDWLMMVKQLNEIGDERISLENALERFFTLNSKESLEPWLSNLHKSFAKSQSLKKVEKSPAIFCIYCNLSFKDRAELTAHCLTQEHETMIMSDEGHDWYWRAPPRGFKSDAYTLCENWRELGTCRFGLQCVEAHGEGELYEWKERFQYREMKMLRAKEKQLYGKSYTENLLEKWVQTPNSNSVMSEKIDTVEDACSCPLSATVSSKNSNYSWKFTMKTNKPLKAVALLQDTHRNHFNLSQIVVGNVEQDIKNNQEFLPNEQGAVTEYHIVVAFQTTIFGTFRQSVVFDFGSEPVLVKHLCVDVVPDSDLEKINEIRKEITLCMSERWTKTNSEIVPFFSTLVSTGTNHQWEKNLLTTYPYPQIENFVLSNATVSEKKLTRNNYRERMHELLYVEEIARTNLISQYNLTTRLQIAHSYLLSPNSMAASTAKYSGNGELFASVCLGKELSEDTAEGRLILMYCNSVYLLPNPLENRSVRKVYEAIIEDKGKDMIYLRLSADTVKELNLTTDTDLEVQIQFQLNRVPYCEWHYTIDKIRNYKLIFPEIYVEPNIPWSPSRQWSSSLDSRLNLKQKEAVVAITTPIHVKIPPILVIGPFGTGKTFTLAQAVKELIKDESNKILLCTHSNSAADLYIKDYLDVWVESGIENARPMRIYYQKRWVATVSPVVQKYCSIKTTGNSREFQLPTLEELEKHKIVVVTLSTSVYLSAMGLSPGSFTHILLDEAAQALECETITPLALATENTRIVLAGDHMQLGPDIFSNFAKERNLHISLLERLYDHYPGQFPCKILLCENYRAHEVIIQFTSESFYDQKLVSSSKQPKHFRFYPLTFFTTLGEDVQDKNSTAFYNNSEVYEVVERVAELKRNWPPEWGEINEQSLGVVTPYSDQVFRIRSELRKRRIDVCVERVLNVQGKQFRAIILSTVRTRRTCTNNKGDSEVDYGFLSNSKLLNTAITRAQSLVAVVGDPIALCSLGRCSKVWERFLQICHDNESLYGITWTQLKFQLDGIELKKVYTLNPLAPEFIPRIYKEMMQENPTFNLPHPKIVPPFPNVPNNIRVVPVVYQQRPPMTLPYVLNLPTTVANGYRPLRLVNPHELVPTPRLNVPTPPVPKNAASSTKLIQFMNNVHFPEAQMLNDCISLLPQHMSLTDMILQPPSVQERWYNYLRVSAGLEAAEKFKYLLHTINQKGTRIADNNVLGRTTPHSSSDSPTFNWYDSPSNQINFNKPIYMKEVETSNWPDCNKSNPLYKRQSQQNRAKDSTSQNGVNKMKESDVQRHVNEDFANMSITSTSNDDWYEAFKAFNGEQSRTSRPVNNSTGFYNYF
ncbi:probable helicase with zinc finger domain [Tribolium castaneum]|uniref:Putative helicase with zinc finger domain-like Protein n=2 Tax=Tribolium castaneum TaxID=7070 RepID=D6WF06_TRICA|nr:PREDICTED: probable helicase with zinc finger domain [Tribolium castaneum]EFA00306.1 putative helicase with zinc finger domain-like Protein [Tribolium castaneum]|eukprot:XP_968116.1 PREDICTED: probable helicase with zinc finger domain [Tribolium castaneum]